MAAWRKLKDLKSAGWSFVAFGLIAPNLFTIIGILVALGYSHFIVWSRSSGRPFTAAGRRRLLLITAILRRSLARSSRITETSVTGSRSEFSLI